MSILKGSKLEKLMADRDMIEAKGRQITEEIKEERHSISLARAKEKEAAYMGATPETYRKCFAENKRLRGMFALISRADGATYVKIAEMMGISSANAKGHVFREMRADNSDISFYAEQK